MDLLKLNGMSEDEKKATQDFLLHEQASLAAWRVHANSVQGQFILKDRKEKRDRLRSVYKAIDTSEPGALMKFARLQGYEECLDSEIMAIENLPAAKERLDNELQQFNLVLEQNKKDTPLAGSSILSKYIKESENG